MNCSLARCPEFCLSDRISITVLYPELPSSSLQPHEFYEWCTLPQSTSQQQSPQQQQQQQQLLSPSRQQKRQLQQQQPVCDSTDDAGSKASTAVSSALAQAKRDFEERLNRLQLEHKEEFERQRQDADLRIFQAKNESVMKVCSLRDKIEQLEQRVEKYRILAGIEGLLSGQDAVAAAAVAAAAAASTNAEPAGAAPFPSSATTASVLPAFGTSVAASLGAASARPASFDKSVDTNDIQQVLGDLSSSSPESRSPLASASDCASTVDAQVQTDISGLAAPPPPPPRPSSLSGAFKSGSSQHQHSQQPGSQVSVKEQIMHWQEQSVEPSRRACLNLKTLYWSPIYLNRLPPGKAGVWESVDRMALPNSRDLERLFARPSNESSKAGVRGSGSGNLDSPPAGATEGKSGSPAKLLNAKRAQNLGIFIAATQIGKEALYSCLVAFEPGGISVEQLKQLRDLTPSQEEMTQIREFVASNPGSVLDKPERFLLSISEIPFFSERLHCMLFQLEHEECVSALESRVTALISVCRQLYESRLVRRVLSLVLALGNLLNHGTSRGRADGFGLDILGKLKDLRSSAEHTHVSQSYFKENTCTLFQVLVSMYIDEHWASGGPELGTVVPFPLPDPEEVKQAADVDLTGVKSELRHLSARLVANEKIVRKVSTSSAPNEREPFAGKMSSFLDRAKQDLSDFRETVTDAETCYSNILMYFCQPPATPPKEFFSHWAAFCIDFKEQLRRQVNLRQRGITKFNISSSVESSG